MRRLLLLSLLLLLPVPCWAAISFVGSAENSAIDGADVTLTLPGGVLENDLVIVAYAIASGNNLAMDMITTGYTEVIDSYANDSNDTNLGVYWKVMGGTPDTTAVVDGVGGTNNAVAAVCMVFRGVDTTTPMDVTPPTPTATGNSNHPNPPSIDYLDAAAWVVIVGGSAHVQDTTSVTYTFPTGYTTNALEIAEIDNRDVTVGMGYDDTPAADPEDPGVMTMSGTDAITNSAVGASLALRPAAAAGGARRVMVVN